MVESTALAGKDLSDYKVAIVHDFLVERGGAERVALEFSRSFPGAPVFTALYRPAETYGAFADVEVRPIFGQRFKPQIPHRHLLPLAIVAFRRLRLDYDLVISSSSGLGHLPRSNGGKRLVYCHTPARWLYRPDQYFRGFDPGLRAAVARGAPLYRPLDRRRMCRSDLVVVNSTVIQNEVRTVYGLDSRVLHPVSALEVGGPLEPTELRKGFFLTPSRLLGYKRVDLILRAARELPDRDFLIVGDGPLRRRLEEDAPKNVRFLGVISDAKLRWLYTNCDRVVLTCAEDFGLVPAEAASFGKVTVVPDARGFRDDRPPGHGIARYEFGNSRSLAEALSRSVGPPRASVNLGSLQQNFRDEMRQIALGLVQDQKQ